MKAENLKWMAVLKINKACICSHYSPYYHQVEISIGNG
jgi:hypothetical protein